ncbi:MAG: glycoside hydrolase family 15 protein [Thermoleophilaceae bacterium]|nr:glycoside hydrolase family 15 protein [Thermoleophilaceae bacterium]
MSTDHNDGFPPIADYAFLSDCETCALVAPSGQVEWLCLPRPDSQSVFGGLLDRSAGVFAVMPAGVTVPTQRRYLPGSMVLETTWRTPTGWLVMHDSLSVGAWTGGSRRPGRRRPPGEFIARNVLLRVITCIDGEAEVLLNCLPLFDYGRLSGSWSYTGDGYECAVVSCDGFDPELRLTTNFQLGLVQARAYSRSSIREGEGVFAALSWGDSAPATLDEAHAQSVETAKHWRQWLKGGTFPDHPWRSYLERSALTLKGLSHAPTGAVLAAATTSLPETPGGERNWDYRFTWIRDSSFLLWGLFTLGFEWEAFEYFSFLAETVAGGDVQIMYGIDGEKDLTEHTLDHLSGYGGARPVRIGNGAYDQKQHDVWGMLLDSFALHVRRNRLSQQLPRAAWDLISRYVEEAIAHWQDADRGIWEVRGDPKHFTASKVLCWVALDRGVKLADDRGDDDRAERWREVADQIKAEVCERGVDDRGVFKQHYDADALDASLLLIPLMGFLPPEDERVRATVLAIADELTEDGLVLRYSVHETDDGLSGEEGTFTMCSFWLVSALSQIGQVERARALCERLLSFASPLELYAEEIDAKTGRHLGNFPQAFTHLSLINAVMQLIEAEKR